MTEEEREEIIEAAVERALLRLPDVIGNLMTHQAMMVKTNKEFYQKYPEFLNQKEIVMRVVEGVESENPGLGYEKILDLSVPRIRESIKTIGSLNTTSVSQPRAIHLPSLSDNGAL